MSDPYCPIGVPQGDLDRIAAQTNLMCLQLLIG